ncbi:unnamed protein product [marine sediment metagenome]|uniref:Uncharacterized protein n=1 Tax=marine sediment metagenome TaxID=412755 RepID=X1HKU9_9ZZZZ
MGHFISDEVIRVDAGNDEWVDIKRQLSVGDYERIARESPDEKPEGRIIATLIVLIKKWNLKDGDKEMPLNRESIERLDADLATQIIAELGKQTSAKKA